MSHHPGQYGDAISGHVLAVSPSQETGTVAGWVCPFGFNGSMRKTSRWHGQQACRPIRWPVLAKCWRVVPRAAALFLSSTADTARRGRRARAPTTRRAHVWQRGRGSAKCGRRELSSYTRSVEGSRSRCRRAQKWLALCWDGKGMGARLYKTIISVLCTSWLCSAHRARNGAH